MVKMMKRRYTQIMVAVEELYINMYMEEKA